MIAPPKSDSLLLLLLHYRIENVDIDSSLGSVCRCVVHCVVHFRVSIIIMVVAFRSAQAHSREAPGWENVKA